ncbi:MAG: LemA family protein [Muribaculaceae bacterium]|nr:LemA family protein [Muribaculaceae bacterium]
MKKAYIIIGVLAVLGLLVFFSGKRNYNKFVVEQESVDQTWSQVENQYQRRLDLIPNLVEAVKGYAKHESETFEKVTEARAGLSQAYNKASEQSMGGSVAPSSQEALDDFQASQQELQRALNIYVNAVREAYPDLKANEQFADLQAQLEGTENRIATERERYTKAVQAYNVSVKTFPANLWAGLFGFDARAQFKADPEAAHAPKVQF